MRRLPAVIAALALAAAPALHASGAREGAPGHVRFEVTDRVEELRLPISAQPVTLSLWTPLPPEAGVANLAELPLYREAARRTGVTVSFVHPRPGAEAEELAVLAASARTPDIIAADWARVPGGPSAAIARELILPLNEIIAAWMPTYRVLLSRWPERARALRTDEGHYYGFPVVAWSSDDPGLALALDAGEGLQARGDLLEGLQVPEPRTLADWDSLLRLLKAKGVETPLLLTLGGLERTHVFASAFGAPFGFFRTDGGVRFGPLEPGFRDFLERLAGWIKDGLVNADFGTLGAEEQKGRILESAAAVWIADSADLQRLPSALRARDEAAAVVPLPPPEALLAGSGSGTGISGARSLALSSRSSRVKISALWVDTWYSDEGRRLQGDPRLNPLPPLVGHFDADAWRRRSPAAAEAARVWSRAATAEHALPRLSPLGRESALEAEVLQRAAEIVREMTLRIGGGSEPLASYDGYAARLEEIGIRDVIAAKQAQLDRYQRR